MLSHDAAEAVPGASSLRFTGKRYESGSGMEKLAGDWCSSSVRARNGPAVSANATNRLASVAFFVNADRTALAATDMRLAPMLRCGGAICAGRHCEKKSTQEQ